MWLESSNHFDSCESLAGQPQQIIDELTEQSKSIMIKLLKLHYQWD